MKSCDLQSISALISVIIEVMAILFALYQFFEYKREKWKAKNDELRQLINAFHCEEDEMAQEIAKLRNDGKAEKSIKTEFRDRAQRHPKNPNEVRPKT